MKKSVLFLLSSFFCFFLFSCNKNQPLSIEHRNGLNKAASTSAQNESDNVQYNPENGHYYAAIATPQGMDWDDAIAAAATYSYNGMKGYLATITSASENNFVWNAFGFSVNNYWLGGYQSAGSPEPAVGWEWITTGEPWNYTNWAVQGEPNNYYGGDYGCESPGGHEEALQFGWGIGQWNDMPECAPLPFGFIVEFNAPDTFTISILNSEMISNHQLGFAVKVKFPLSSAKDKRFIKVSTNINGTDIVDSFNVTSLTTPGQEATIGLASDNTVASDSPLRISLTKYNVMKFSDNIKYSLTVFAKSMKSGQSNSDMKEFKILLPVIMVNGFLADVWPGPNKFYALKQILISNGYFDETTLYPTILLKEYSSLQSCKKDAQSLITDCKQLLKRTYAESLSVIGYSRGGLISRYAISSSNIEVKKLIMIGTPNNGSTFAVLTSNKIIRELQPTYDWLYNNDESLAKAQQALFQNQFLTDLNNQPDKQNVKFYSIYNTGIANTFYTMYYNSEGDYILPRSPGAGDGIVLALSARIGGATPYPIYDASDAGKHGNLPVNPLVIVNILSLLGCNN